MIFDRVFSPPDQKILDPGPLFLGLNSVMQERHNLLKGPFAFFQIWVQVVDPPLLALFSVAIDLRLRVKIELPGDI